MVIFPPIQAFIDLVKSRQRPGMRVAEVGCYDGTTSQLWVPVVSAQSGLSIMVDNFCGNPGSCCDTPHAPQNYNASQVLETLCRRVSGYPPFLILKSDSSDAASFIEDGSLDIVFLDADHRYSQTSKNISAWLRKIKSGGIMCGHDCESSEHDPKYIEHDFVEGKHHGVIKAVYESFPKAERLADSCWKAEV